MTLIDKYLGRNDWRIWENSNVSYSLQGLNNFVTGKTIAKYWLEEIYPQDIAESHKDGWMHIHDLSSLSAYCVGLDLQDLLMTGFKGNPEKVVSKPAKHLSALLGQIVNMTFTIAGEVAGAVAWGNFDTLLAPFVKEDGLTYEQVKQLLQEFVYNMNVPTRVGHQPPFSNLTLDLVVPSTLKDQPVVVGGKALDYTYADCKKEMDMINKALCEVFLEGDGEGKIFTFPIPTYNITADFDWDNPEYELLWEMTAKYGYPYFSNFVNSDMSPEDVRSFCCRLRSDVTEIKKRGGGLFGSSPLTGSLGVVTLNLPRIGYFAKGNKQTLFALIRRYMELAKKSLLIKREVVEELTEKGLYPYVKFTLRNVKMRFGKYWANHFNTIGLVGLNECVRNFTKDKHDLTTKKGNKIGDEILGYMNKVLLEFQEETGQMFNLEATPAEGTSYRLARKDKEMYPDIKTAGKNEPYYTNSCHLPVGYTSDIFEMLELEDELQTKFSGGTVVHLYLPELVTKDSVKVVLKKVFESYKLPYISFTPTFSICEEHGYIAGEEFVCPQCGKETLVYSRVVGFFRPIQNWNFGKKSEYEERKEYEI